MQDAHKVINGERQDAYGNPEDCFAQIAALWNWYLSAKGKKLVDAADVAMMMVLLKVAREASNHKRDNVVDACGYLGLYGDMFVEKTMADCCVAVGRERVGWDAVDEDDMDAFAKALESTAHVGTTLTEDK